MMPHVLPANRQFSLNDLVGKFVKTEEFSLFSLLLRRSILITC